MSNCLSSPVSAGSCTVCFASAQPRLTRAANAGDSLAVERMMEQLLCSVLGTQLRGSRRVPSAAYSTFRWSMPSIRMVTGAVSHALASQMGTISSKSERSVGIWFSKLKARLSSSASLLTMSSGCVELAVESQKWGSTKPVTSWSSARMSQLAIAADLPVPELPTTTRGRRGLATAAAVGLAPAAAGLTLAAAAAGVAEGVAADFAARTYASICSCTTE